MSIMYDIIKTIVLFLSFQILTGKIFKAGTIRIGPIRKDAIMNQKHF